MTLDLALIQSRTYSKVITLNPQLERSFIGGEGGEPACKELGLAWTSFEMRDLSLRNAVRPCLAQQKALKIFLEAIAHDLRLGQRIVLHCYAGKGRLATLACLIMQGFGLSADDAIKCIQRIKPGALACKGQLALVKDWSGALKQCA